MIRLSQRTASRSGEKSSASLDLEGWSVGSSDGPFRCLGLGVGTLVDRLSRRMAAGFRCSGGVVLFGGTGRCCSAGVRQGLELVESVGEDVGPVQVRREAEVAAAAGDDEPGGGGEQP